MQHLCLHTNDTTLDIWVKLGLKALFPQLFQGVKVVNDAFNSITTNSPPRWTERTDIVTCPRFFFSWILHFDAVEGSIDDFDALKKLWEECLETKLDPDVKGRIIGVQTQMLHYNTLFGLLLSKTILKISDNLSRTLQKQQCQQLRDGR